MADIRGAELMAANPNEDSRMQGSSNYDFVFGTPENSDYAAGDFSAGSDYAAGSGWDVNSDYAAGGGWERPLQDSRMTAREAMTMGYRNLQNYRGPSQGGLGATNWADGYKAAAQAASSGAGGTGGTRATYGAGQGASAARTPYATIRESTTVLPKGMTWPTFTAPKWDEKKVEAKAQRITAPLIRELGSKVQQEMSRYYENPNVRRMVLRDTLSGYGIGMSRAMAAGRSAAASEYGAEYGREWTEAMTNYSIAKDKLMSQAVQVQSQRAVNTAQDLEKITNNQLIGTSGNSLAMGNNRTTKFNFITGKSYNVAATR